MSCLLINWWSNIPGLIFHNMDLASFQCLAVHHRPRKQEERNVGRLMTDGWTQLLIRDYTVNLQPRESQHHIPIHWKQDEKNIILCHRDLASIWMRSSAKTFHLFSWSLLEEHCISQVFIILGHSGATFFLVLFSSEWMPKQWLDRWMRFRSFSWRLHLHHETLERTLLETHSFWSILESHAWDILNFSAIPRMWIR